METEYRIIRHFHNSRSSIRSTYSFYEGWKFNSGNYLFTTDTK